MRFKRFLIGITAIAIVVGALGLQSNITQAATQTFGNTVAGSLNDYGDTNYLNGSRFKTGATGGTLTSMSANVGAVGAAPNNKYQLAIYADNVGQPGALIAQSAQGTLTANSWNTLPLSATVTANTYYWLMYSTNGTSYTVNNLNYTEGGTGGYTTNGAPFGTIPNPFGSFTGNTLNFSLYATYNDSTTPTPPTVSMTAPASGATVSGTTTAVSATATDTIGMAGVQFKLDGANLGAEDTTSPYSVNWNTTTATNGSHTLTAVARNTSGLTTTSSSRTVTVSNAAATPPTVSLTAPANGATVSGTTTAVSANASDAVSVSGVQFKLDGANLGSEDTSSPYSVNWNTTTATNGSHTLTAVARNASGLTTTSSARTVTVNNVAPTPPTVTLTTPANGATVSGSTQAVSANASDAVSVSGVQFKLDGANLGSEDTTSPYSVNWNTTTATNGSHTLTAVARNASGLTTTSSAVTVTVNNVAPPTPPTVSLTAPASGATVSGTTQAVSANASDAVSVAGVQFKLDGANLGSEDTSSPYSVNWNTTTATNGSHTLTAVARNASGLTTTSSAVTVTVNNVAPPTPPTVSITAPAANATVGGSQTVTANASDAVGVAGVQFKLDGANLGSEDTISPYSVVWNTTSSTNATHTLTAIARNASGLTTTSSTVTVTVSNAPAVPTGLAGTAASTTQVNLSWTASSGATSYKVYRNGTLVGSPTATTYQDTGLTATTNYSYTVAAVNTFGLASAQSGAVSVTTQSQGTTQTFGVTTPGSLTDDGDNNYLNGTQFTTGASGGTLTSMSAFVAAIDSAPNNKFQLGIYADSNNTPGALVAQSAQGTLTANSWNSLPLSATLTANTKYWLMYNTNGTSLALNALKYTDGGSGGYTANGAPFGTMPSPFGAFATNPRTFSINATYTTTGTPPSAPATPTGLTASNPSPSTSQISVSWNASSGATSYKVYRNGSLIASPTTTSIQDSGLTAGTSYSYTVSAVNSSGESAQSSAVTGSTAPNNPGGVIFFDDFLGTSVDTAKWDVYDRISDQANSEVNCMTPDNVTVSSGILNIASKFEDRTCGDSQQAPVLEHYTSGQIAQKTAPFTYGTVEVRAKEPGGTGIWPTIFLLGGLWQPSQAATANIPGHDWPNGGWGEVDIAEFLFNNRTQVNNVAHVNQFGGTVQAPLPYDATTRFMVYRLQWTATSLVFSVDAEDGVGFRTLRTITDTNNIPQVPYYLTINAAIGGNGGGTPNPSTFPQTFQLDWVKITQ